METKICNRCNTEKPISEFRKDVKRGKRIVRPQCKICYNKTNKLKYIRNKERVKKAAIEYYHKNKETIAITKKIWREANRERQTQKSKQR